jgi:hypothetical protein
MSGYSQISKANQTRLGRARTNPKTVPEHCYVAGLGAKAVPTVRRPHPFRAKL